MNRVLDREQPNFRYFEEICMIPRASFHEKKIADYLVDFAKKHNLWYYRDDMHNVIIKKKATFGKKKAEPIILQAHTDMVCVKTEDSSHDFLNDPLELYIKDGCLYAKGTTLGADDGAGVANILAILEDDTLEHPLLECVFTVQEEDGIGGAKGLDFSQLTAKRMISLDGLREGTTIVRAPSVLGFHLKKDFVKIEPQIGTVFYQLKINGLRSGHGASNIGDERANAIKLVARILYHLKEQFPIGIVEWNGGNLANIIAAESEVIFGFNEKDEEVVKERICEIFHEIKYNYRETDPDISLMLDKTQANYILTVRSTEEIIDLAYIIPHGLIARDPKRSEDFWASYNFSILRTEEARMVFSNVCRACYPFKVEELKSQLLAIVKKYNVEAEKFYEYAGHSVDGNSELITLYEKVYKKYTGKELIRKVNHGGLDIGSICEGMEELDVAVLMPNTYDVHTVNEHLDLDSYKRSLVYLREILQMA